MVALHASNVTCALGDAPTWGLPHPLGPHVTPTTHEFSSCSTQVISACEKQGQWQWAMHLLQQIRARHRPTAAWRHAVAGTPALGNVASIPRE